MKAMRSKTAALAAILMLIATAEQAFAICGDGTKEVSEACDDGNDDNGDGCSDACLVEAGFTCQDFDPLAAQNANFETTPQSPQWEILAGGIDWLDGTANGACMPAGEGTYSIDLNQLTQGLVAQTFATEPGKTYGVLFLASANCIMVGGQSCALTCTRTMAMGAAANTAADTLTDIGQPIATTQYEVSGSPQAAGWQRLRVEFTATSTSTIIFFWGSDTAAAGPMLDDVSIPTSWCLPNTCGNGALDVGADEACDDGNSSGGDGCSADCSEIEVGYTCATPGAACTAACGDGVRQPTEGCDDDGTTDGDGCSATCAVEAGWSCTEVPPAQVSTCTDIDLCADASCGMGTCQEGAETFTCVCDAGYEFDDQAGTCIDIDECETTCDGDNVEACNNLPGSFECVCNVGYELTDDGCADINECEDPHLHCPGDETCVNFPGGSKCEYKSTRGGACDASSAPALGTLAAGVAVLLLASRRRRRNA